MLTGWAVCCFRGGERLQVCPIHAGVVHLHRGVPSTRLCLSVQPAGGLASLWRVPLCLQRGLASGKGFAGGCVMVVVTQKRTGLKLLDGEQAWRAPGGSLFSSSVLGLCVSCCKRGEGGCCIPWGAVCSLPGFGVLPQLSAPLAPCLFKCFMLHVHRVLQLYPGCGVSPCCPCMAHCCCVLVLPCSSPWCAGSSQGSTGC